MDQPDAQETGGLYFPLLISNLCRFLLVLLNTHLIFLVVGVYIQHLCLIGLFFLAEDAQGNLSHCADPCTYAKSCAGRQSAYPQGICMLALLAFTIIVHYFLHSTFNRMSLFLI